MANLCSNTVVLVGSPEKLTTLKDIITELDAGGKYVLPEGICEKLGIDISKDGHSYDTGMGKTDDMEFATIPEGYFRFDCCTAWGACRSIWDKVCRGMELNGYALFSEADGDYWVVNDPIRFWFPQQYVFDSYGEGTFAELETEYYNSKEDLCAALNKIAREEKSFEEWQEYLEDNDDEGAIKIIERDGNNQTMPYK